MASRPKTFVALAEQFIYSSVPITREPGAGATPSDHGPFPTGAEVRYVLANVKIERSKPSLRFAGLCAAILLGVAFAGAGCGGSGGGGHAGDGGAGAGGGAGNGDGAAGTIGSGGQDAGSAGTTGSGGQADGASDAAQDGAADHANEPDAADSGALDGSDAQSDAALDGGDAATDAAPLGWVLVRIGDCSGTDRAIGYSTGSDTPVDGDCTHAENGLAAVCWDQTTYHNELVPGTAPGCTYKTITAASCTDGTRPGRLYVCNRP
jgi:hypothetical protein